MSVGNKVVVAGGLFLVGTSFAWVSTASTTTAYLEIAGQMVLAGIGLGFTSAPATEAIMGVVPNEKAGVGSAVNDATRELGATLGVAVIGSVFASIYRAGIDESVVSIPAPARRAATESVGAAIAAAQQLGPDGTQLLALAKSSFFDGFHAGCLVAAGVLVAGSAFAAVFLPSPPTAQPHPTPDTAARAEREPARSPKRAIRQ